MIRNMICFYGEELLAPRPTPKLERHPLSAVRDCLFNIFSTTLHIGSSSSIRNLRTHHAVVTGTHLPRIKAMGYDVNLTDEKRKEYASNFTGLRDLIKKN